MLFKIGFYVRHMVEFNMIHIFAFYRIIRGILRDILYILYIVVYIVVIYCIVRDILYAIHDRIRYDI